MRQGQSVQLRLIFIFGMVRQSRSAFMGTKVRHFFGICKKNVIFFTFFLVF